MKWEFTIKQISSGFEWSGGCGRIKKEKWKIVVDIFVGLVISVVRMYKKIIQMAFLSCWIMKWK